MSRYVEADEYHDYYDNPGALWQANVRRALKGRRGKKALAELREALLHLPEKRLISRALCTVNADARRPEAYTLPSGTLQDWQVRDFNAIIEEVGEGVCAVGAYIWWQNVKKGMSPEEAFEKVPTAPDTETELYETAELGQEHGLTFALAWELAYRNDEKFESKTPEERYEAFMAWIDEELAA